MGRRQITTALTLLVLVGILVFGAVAGWRFMVGEPDSDAEAKESPSSCTTEKVGAGQRIRSSQVRVSVYNAGTRSGLANSTLDALLRRGFVAGEAGNAPADAKVRHVQVWSTIENDPAAKLVARQFGKGVPVKFSDEELGPGVDVIVGDRFRRLVKAPRSIKVRQPQEVCTPTSSSAPQAGAAASR